MSIENVDIARAWKDEEYRNSLTAEQRATLPQNPAGEVALSDETVIEEEVTGYLAGTGGSACLASKRSRITNCGGTETCPPPAY